MFCVWLLPKKKDESTILDLIKYNQTVLHMPCFQPHLTVFDGCRKIDKHLVSEFLTIVRELSTINIKIRLKVLDSAVCEDKYYKSFYIKLNETSDLRLLYSHISELDLNSIYEFNPHVSLAYGNSCSQINLLKTNYELNNIEFDRICLVSDTVEESAEAIESWEIITSCKLYR